MANVRRTVKNARKSKKSDALPKDQIAQELVSIRQSLETLRSSLGVDAGGHMSSREQHQLSVFITRSNTPAKPFLVQCEGALTASFKLSPIRAAIFIMLIVDLEDRIEGGGGVEEPFQTVASIAEALGTEEAEAEGEGIERVRVAIYRFWEFCQSTDYLKGPELELDFDDKRIKFVALHRETRAQLNGLKIEVTSDDQTLTSVLTRVLTRSPLEQVRRRKALFVPAGPDGADRLLLEMYDHPYPLTVTSLYVRPPLPSYPDDLLEKMQVSARVKRRKALAFEGYRSGRVQFFEVLNEDTIWDLIRGSDADGFKMYPRVVGRDDIASHLANLIDILRRYDNYHFYITKIAVPFVVVTYDIQSRIPPECFTVFFQASESAAQRDLGCFALCDRAVYQNISEHIVQWILNHPSTKKDRSEVIGFLERALAHLREKGPLSIDGAAPE
jgi:hypothetical protein